MSVIKLYPYKRNITVRDDEDVYLKIKSGTTANSLDTKIDIPSEDDPEDLSGNGTRLLGTGADLKKERTIILTILENAVSNPPFVCKFFINENEEPIVNHSKNKRRQMIKLRLIFS